MAKDKLPNYKLSQHFLIDPSIYEVIQNHLNPECIIIEIGPGTGNLTQILASSNNTTVISFEIDKRFKSILEPLKKKYSNLDIVYTDFLKIKWHEITNHFKGNNKYQIVSSLPYHITEPLLHKIIDFPIENALLIVGSKLAYAIEAKDENDINFTSRTLIVNTFFKYKKITDIPKTSFNPPPRTKSALIKLIPKSQEEIRSDNYTYILSQFFSTSKHNPRIKNVLKESIISIYNGKFTQNEARSIISKLSIFEEILNSSFSQLSNNQLRTLSTSIKKLLSNFPKYH